MNKKITFLLTITLLFFSISNAVSQDFSISGKVTDENGEGLIGVNVVVKSTGKGTITDIDGNYSLTVPEENNVLEFSFVGYKGQEFTITSSNSSLNITLEEDITSLEEVVVTGLASSIKRSNLANAVSTVSAKDLTGTTSPSTLDGALQGKLTGANIIANSGAPGGGISMKLRGITTITGSSEPLYIVDGVYMDNSAISAGTNPVTQASRGSNITTNQDNPSNRIADLNPDEIENIEILKGASAAAIYGSRANAGVVIITTKKGKNGKTKINFNQDIGYTSILNPLGSREFTVDKVRNLFDLTTEKGIEAANAEVALFQKAQQEGRLIDWEQEMYGNIGLITKSNLSLSGGTEKTKFFISGTLNDEEGIIKNTGYSRKSLRTNIDHKLSNLINFSVNSNYIHSSADRGLTNNDNAGVSYGVALTSTKPWADLFPDEDGNYPNNPYAGSNPIQTRDLSTINETTNRILTGSTVNFHFINTDDTFLKMVLRGGVDYYNNESNVYFPEDLQFMGVMNGFYSRGNNRVINTNASAFLVFNKSINKVDFTSQLGTSRLDFNQDRLTTQATQLIGGQKNLEQASAVSVFNKSLKTIDIGYSFQQEANFADKLILTAGIRLDKSSLNGDPNKLYAFPKISAATNLHNFDFWSVDPISQLKVRLAYGEAGGVPSPHPVNLQQPSFTIFNGTGISGQAGSIIGLVRGNKDIQPERSKEIEAGLDIGFFDNKINLEATYYNKTVEDLILRANVPYSSGFTSRTVNGGALNNKGIEIALSTTPVDISNLKWESRTSFWKNRSKMTRLDVPSFTTGGFSSALGIFRIEEGKSVTQIVGYVGDEEVVIGNAEPDFQMSSFNTLTFFKNIEFTMLWHWKQGGDNINLTKLLSDFGGTTFDYDEDDDNNGIINGDQRKIAYSEGNSADEFIEDATYLKLREIALFYNIPKKVIGSTLSNYISYLKVGVSANNALMFTKYSSYDPEVSNFGNNGISTGVEVTPFPSSRKFFFHLSVGL
ncbi:SusC/RagA family TonB-linked outer membrane protein [Xanthovirga aplysinae]|uniref:SusC/RagA family TonB-linked outer membrane protein n=1 Tax=Xanthovirga aplysinae TaxID=2529853 RepID=UPI0012BD49BA|nr:SusC/RagA family TonB-linked outer membrane protein [Xanthovirga aplysinae]MTI32242.1 SusC/RagA family TonB-linked outer membrane protein [Xanthovirga aplysinae]